MSAPGSMTAVTFGSVCSGIEAASVAWHPLGWRAAWLAEIEPFPSAVLAHHYPDVPNMGDMTAIAARVLAGDVPAPDVLCGGTPCQAFSVAGLRQSLRDERGNLTLRFVELANAIDAVRAGRGETPSIIFWENVPGVLSTGDNAFGNFLAGLAGEDRALEPPGGKWTNAGAVLGPKRAVAWRVLDAQYFGLAQRRRRVFVVASARRGINPAEILFEWDGVRRDSAPRRAEGENVAGTLASRTGAGGCPGSGEAGTGHVQPVTCMAHGQSDAEVRTDGGTPTLTCNHEAPIVVYGTQDPDVQRDMAYTMGRNQGQENAVCVAMRSRQGVPMPELGGEVMNALSAAKGGSNKPHVLAKQCAAHMAVRRLTPEECEALQGLQRGYTRIQWRGKPAEQCPDGPRYRALGNSWAVPVVRWIGERMARQISQSGGAQ